MLDRKAADVQVVDGEILSGFKCDPIGISDIGFPDDMGGFGGGVKRSGMFFDKTFQAADVIAVLVREQDRGNGGGFDVE